jgi:membrane-associated phospholipid phosphatase
MIWHRATTLLGAALGISSAASGQSADTTRATDKTFFSRRDAVAAGLITATSVVISVFDERIARWTQTPVVQGGDARRDVVNVLTMFNEVPLTLGAGAVWAVGRMTHQSTMADVGLHTAEALLLTVGASEIVRGSLGRMRPRESPDDSYEFQYGKGFTQFAARSFPSIHSGVAFAAATALNEEVRIRRPGAVRYAAPVLYTMALVPGITRMYLNQHWTSDIVAGAAVGTLMGRRAVRYAHSHRPSALEAKLLGVTILPDGNRGVMIMVRAVR